MHKQELDQPAVKSLVTIFNENKSHILFQFDDKNDKLLRFPAGKIKKSESAINCIKREVTKEEFLIELTQIESWIFCENFFLHNKQIEHEILIIHSAKLKNKDETFPKTHLENADVLIDWFRVSDLDKSQKSLKLLTIDK